MVTNFVDFIHKAILSASLITAKIYLFIILFCPSDISSCHIIRQKLVWSLKPCLQQSMLKDLVNTQKS